VGRQLGQGPEGQVVRRSAGPVLAELAVELAASTEELAVQRRPVVELAASTEELAVELEPEEPEELAASIEELAVQRRPGRLAVEPGTVAVARKLAEPGRQLELGLLVPDIVGTEVERAQLERQGLAARRLAVGRMAEPVQPGLQQWLGLQLVVGTAVAVRRSVELGPEEPEELAASTEELAVQRRPGRPVVEPGTEAVGTMVEPGQLGQLGPRLELAADKLAGVPSSSSFVVELVPEVERPQLELELAELELAELEGPPLPAKCHFDRSTPVVVGQVSPRPSR
jgi:hypothetical protein